MAAGYFRFGVLHARYAQLQGGVGIAVARCVLICGCGTGELVELLAALAHAERHLAAQGSFLALGEFVVDLAIGLLSVEILSACHLLVGGGKFGSAASGEQDSREYGRYENESVHFPVSDCRSSG